MTDKATMPEYKTYDLKANIRTYIPDFDMASEIMVRLQTLDSLAAVAGRMAEAIDAGIDRLSVDYPKDRIAADKMNEALSAYNALMKGR